MELSSIILSDEKRVPRPLNCFMTYRLEKQREILEQCPGANHRDISKITANWWKNMTFAEKEPYRRKAEQAKYEHLKLYPNYRFTPRKKVLKTRAYKKRPESEYTSEDLKQRQQLASLYHYGMPSASSTNTTAKDTNSADEREYSPYVPCNDSQRGYYNNNETGYNLEYMDRLPRSTSLPSVSKSSPLQLQSKMAENNNRKTGLPPFAVPSHSVAPSPSPSTSGTHSMNSSPKNFSVLGKTDYGSSSHYYGSTNLLQEPPSDPFDSPYSNCSKISISSNFNNYPTQSGSSVSLPLFHHFPHHRLQHEGGGGASNVYNIDKKGSYGNDGADRQKEFLNLFHPMTKTVHPPFPIYHPSTQY